MSDHKTSTAIRHLAGPVFLAVVALIYNAAAIRSKRPTISSGIRWTIRTNLGPEAAGAIIGLLLFHWFLKDTKETV